MLQKALFDIGLSEKEVAVYLALVKLGSQPVSVIAAQAKINRTTTYVILKSLYSKGLVSKFYKGDILYFTPNDPDNLTLYVERRRAELKDAEKTIQDLLPKLKMSEHQSMHHAKVSFFEGFEGLCAMYDQTLKVGAPISEFIFDYTCDYPKVWEFWNLYIRRRKELNIPVRILLTDNDIGLKMKENDVHELRETRLVPKQSFSFGNTFIVIFGDCYAYFSYVNETFKGAIIEDKYLSSMEQHIFDYMWSSCADYDAKLTKKYRLELSNESNKVRNSKS